MNAWLLANSIGLLVVVLVLFLMVRQVGYLLHRFGPVGARSTPEGPRIGENIRHLLSQAGLLERSNNSRPVLFVFGSDSCGICKTVRSAAEKLAQNWHHTADIFIVYDGKPVKDAPDQKIDTIKSGLYFTYNRGLRDRIGVSFVPFAVMANANGDVIGKGLVNEISHLESLLELIA